MESHEGTRSLISTWWSPEEIWFCESLLCQRRLALIAVHSSGWKKQTKQESVTSPSEQGVQAP